MPRRSFAFVVCLAVPSGTFAQQPTHRIEFTDHQSITASIGYELRSREFAVTRWIVALAEPPELPSQTKLKVTSEPASKVIAEKSPMARKLRMFDVPLANPTVGAKLAVRQDIQAVLRSRKLVALAPDEKPPAVPALTAAERKSYLAASRHVDFDKHEFKNWLDAKKLHRAKGESPIDYAGRVLEFIRSDYGYRFDPMEEKRASVSCLRAATDCGGMSLIFVGAMRAHDIPARVLVGRFAQPRKPGTTSADTDYDQPHVRAEFFVNGVGWVPVDPAFANRNRDRPLAEFLGHDTGELLVLHVDLDLRIPILEKEQTADLLQVEPYVWALGSGKLDVALTGSKWELKAKALGEK